MSRSNSLFKILMSIGHRLAIWLLVVLSSAAFAQMPARAQDVPQTFQIISAGTNGLGRGQTLRYTWVNLSDPDPRRGEFERLSLQVTLFTAEGRVIAQAEAPAVEAGKFQFFDFNRDEIKLPGEPDTGRLQVRLEAKVIRTGNFIADVSYEHTVEIIDTLTGHTTFGDKPKEIVVVGSKIDRGDEADFSPSAAVEGQDAIWLDVGGPLGVVPRQTLRITVLLPRLCEDEPSYKMTVAPILFDAEGIVIARRDEITLEPGQSYSFDFKRSELPPGEPGTDRLQVRAEIARRFFPGIASRILQGKAPGALELIDEGSGKTVFLLPAVQALRSPARRIQCGSLDKP
jgi:hypothetical protein